MPELRAETSVRAKPANFRAADASARRSYHHPETRDSRSDVCPEDDSLGKNFRLEGSTHVWEDDPRSRSGEVFAHGLVNPEARQFRCFAVSPRKVRNVALHHTPGSLGIRSPADNGPRRAFISAKAVMKRTAPPFIQCGSASYDSDEDRDPDRTPLCPRASAPFNK